MIRSVFSWFVGEDLMLVFTAKTPTNIAGWTIVVTLYNREGGTALSAPSMVTAIIDPTNGVFQVPLSNADSVALGRTPGFLQARRTDSGHNTVLAEGPINTAP